MTNKDFTFYTDTEYWNELKQLFRKTKRGDRIAMIVMGFDPAEPAPSMIADELLQAADRGVHTNLVVDAYNFLLNTEMEVPGPLWWRTNLNRVPRHFRERLRYLAELDAKAVGRATIINKPNRAFTNPVAGRSHIKYTIVNNRIFVGGCNLHHTSSLDLMVGWENKDTADYLYKIIQELHEAKSTQKLFDFTDRQLALDDKTTLYIDSGKRGQSIIFKEALKLIDSAEKSLVITCQYFPNSVTAQHLAAAKRRGVDVEVIYAHPSKQGRIGGIGQQVSLLRERTRVPAQLFEKRLPKDGPGLHAKLIATEKGAIIGSHNYVRAGVALGTAEIALLRHDPLFAKQALEALKRLLN